MRFCPLATGHGAALHRYSYPINQTSTDSSVLPLDIDMAAMLPANQGIALTEMKMHWRCSALSALHYSCRFRRG